MVHFQWQSTNERYSYRNPDEISVRAYLILNIPTFRPSSTWCSQSSSSKASTESTPESIHPGQHIEAPTTLAQTPANTNLDTVTVETKLDEAFLTGRSISFSELYNLHWDASFTESWRLKRCKTLLPVASFLLRVVRIAAVEDVNPEFKQFEQMFRFLYRLRHFRLGPAECVGKVENIVVVEGVEDCVTGGLMVDSEMVKLVQIDAEGMIRKRVRMMERWKKMTSTRRHLREVVKDEKYLARKLWDNAGPGEERFMKTLWECRVLRRRRMERLWEELEAVMTKIPVVADENIDEIDS